MASPAAEVLSEQERQVLREALKTPRGRYDVTRAVQLSGVPRSTVYHWARTGVLVPDYSTDTPKAWSYRDLVYLRLTVWLRIHGLALEDVAGLVRTWRELFESDSDAPTEVLTDGIGVALGHFDEDILSGQAPFEKMAEYVAKFDLLAPVGIYELRRRHIWGPNLFRPTRQTTISPWVMSGEPCLSGSRIPTSNLYALSINRGLQPHEIAKLYPASEPVAIVEAIELETRLRKAAA